MKKAIFFGGNGYIGKHLIFFLEKNGISIQNFTRQEIDITNHKNLSKIDWNVDFVFNFASLTGTYNSFEKAKEFIEINQIGMVNILNSITNSAYRPKVIFPSSRLVYQGSKDLLREDSFLEAKTIYAATKIFCESTLHSYHNIHNINYNIFRIGVPYGNHFENYSYGTIGFFINQAKNNKVINLYGDGSLRRTFTYIEDICTQIINIIDSKNTKNQIFNIAGQNLSLKTVAQFIATKYEAKINYIDFPEIEIKIESGDTAFDFNKILAYSKGKNLANFENWIEELKS